MDLTLSSQEEEELLEMFSFESQEMHEQLNNLLTTFESNPNDKETINEIFRITHTMKGSAMGMGIVGIAEISHVLEDIFGEIKSGNIELNKSLFTSLYKACDKLGELIKNIKEKKKISHKGIKTKLQVILRKSGGLTGMEIDNAEQTKNEPSESLLSESPEPNEAVEASKTTIAEPEVITTETFDIGSKETKQVEINNKENLITKLINNIKSSGLWEKLRNLIRQRSITAEKNEESIKQEASAHQNMQEGVINESLNLESSAIQSNDEPLSSYIKDEERPRLATNDEQSVFELLDGLRPNVSEDNDLLKNLQDKAEITDLVQVPIRKLDNLMNQVGQLIIERDRLMSINSMNGSRNTEFAGLQRITSDLQYSVMDVRLVQIGTLFNKFHRIARDVAAIENKQVNLKVIGEEVEIDRNILKIMSDSMIHLVRNAVGHGIESAEDRKRLSKPEVATLTLSARNEKDNVVIEVSDDGKGIDAEAIRKKVLEKGMASSEFLDQLSEDDIIMYIFETGFSNAAKLSEVSGRGVGMDVVKKSTESIGGQVLVITKVGEGTTIRLTLPSSMAVKGVLMFQMAEQEFAFALSYTEAVISLRKKTIHKAGVGLISSYLKQTISIVFFDDLLKMKDFSEVYEPETLHRTFDQYEADSKFDVIVISYGGKLIGIVVDKLLQQKEIIEKTIPKPLDNNKLLSGTTILGNGNLCLIVDAAAITDILYKSKFKIHEELNAS